MRPSVALGGVLAVLFIAGAAAHAKSDDPEVIEAKKHFQRGMAHYNLTEYKEAAVEFQAAYRIYPDPVFLYNLAQSYRLSNQPELALQFYRTYLRAEPKAPNKREVDSRIQDLERLISAKQSITRPPDATLAPRETAKAPPVEKPEPRPRRPEPAPVAKPVAKIETPTPRTEPPPPVRTEAPPPVRTEPPPPTATAPPASEPAPRAELGLTTTPTRRTPIYKKWWLWTIVGVVVVGAAVGIGVGVALTSSGFANNTFPRVDFGGMP